MNKNGFKLTQENSKENQSKYDKLKKCIHNMSDELKFKFWIKTLISSQSTLPEIIKTVDKIIEIQASSISFAADIYNKNKSTYSQFEKVIDLTERKNSLLNIYIITKEMCKNLSTENFELLERKYIFNWSADEIAKFYDISLRTVYRKIDKIINLIYEFCLKNKWSLKFIESQTREEGWLKEKYLKLANEYFKNTNYKDEQYQSKSSSEL